MLTLIGVAIAAIPGIGGLFLALRRGRTDDMTAIVTSALAVSDRNQSDAHDCNERLEVMSGRLDKMAAELHDCNVRHQRAEDAMRAAGITMD